MCVCVCVCVCVCARACVCVCMHVCVHVPNKQLRGQLASSKFLKRKATQLSTKDNCVQIWGHCSTKRLTFKVVCPSSAARTTKELLDAPFDT